MSTVKTFQAEDLRVNVYESQPELARDAARMVGAYLKKRIEERGSAAAILATGNSQIKFLEALTAQGAFDWSKMTLFHMDEYLGIPAEHPAGFAHYMKHRVEAKVKPGRFHFLQGDAPEPLAECERYTRLLQAQPIDLCCLGIGENGHLAFNDPPVANFEDPHWVKLVKLDDSCKMQQVKEGHFPSLQAVPPFAYTLTIPALVSAAQLVCLAPETRKAIPVRDALKGPVSTHCPASILRRQAHATLLLDRDSAALL